MIFLYFISAKYKILVQLFAKIQNFYGQAFDKSDKMCYKRGDIGGCLLYFRHLPNSYNLGGNL